MFVPTLKTKLEIHPTAPLRRLGQALRSKVLLQSSVQPLAQDPSYSLRGDDLAR